MPISLAIDLGTSRTKVGWRDETGAIRLLDWNGSPCLPTVLFLPPTGNRILKGQRALIAAQDDPLGIITNLKRTVLRKGSGHVQSAHPGRHEYAQILVNSLFEYIDETCREQIPVFAESELDIDAPLPLEKLVITLPAASCSTDSSEWLDLLRLGAKSIGLTNTSTHLVFLEEPEAVARGWLLEQGATDTSILVIDSGGGTTDWILLISNKQGRLNPSRKIPGESEVLGGMDVDTHLHQTLRTLNPDLTERNDDRENLRNQHHLLRRLREYKEAVLAGNEVEAFEIGGLETSITPKAVKQSYEQAYVTPLLNRLTQALAKVEQYYPDTSILLTGGGTHEILKQHLSSATSLRLESVDQDGLAVVRGSLVTPSQQQNGQKTADSIGDGRPIYKPVKIKTFH